MDFAEDGSIASSDEFTEMQAADVAVTPGFLYVMHDPDPGIPSGYGPGIYVFDVDFRNVAYFQMDPVPYVFAVNQENTHIYANDNDTVVRIYRIQRFGSD